MVCGRWLRIVLVSLVGCAMPALADETLWKLLEGGGRVVLVRHAITTPGVGDPEGMRLDDCRTQRNLTDAGRAHARSIGEAFRARKVPVVSPTRWAASGRGGGGDPAGRARRR